MRRPGAAAWWPPHLPTSLRGRLALSALVVTAVWVVVLTVAFDIALSVRLRASADDVLRARAEGAATTVSVQADGSLAIKDPHDDSAIDTNVWVFQGTRPLVRPAGEDAQSAQARALVQRGELFATTQEPGARRFYALPIRAADDGTTTGTQVGTVVTALDLDPYQRTEDLVQLASAVLGILLLAAVYLLTRRSVARALQPVAEMADQAARWSATDVDHRFGAAARPDELAGLAGQLDGVLDRLAAVLRREQRLNGELSHELRTPLARLVAEAELGARPGRSPEQMRAALDAVLEHAEGVTRILETLLTTARSRSAPPGRCECGAVLTSLARTAGHGGVDRVQVRVDVPEEVWVGASADVLERAVSPLLDNALRYARSTVVLQALRIPEAVLVRVGDDGPGVAPAVRDDPFAVGRRVEDGHGGAGLGLALARRLAQAAGGDVRLLDGAVGDGSLGGAAFELHLPPA